MRLRTMPMVLAVFLLHCGAADEDDTTLPAAAGDPRPGGGANGESDSTGAGASAGPRANAGDDAGTAFGAGTSPFSPKDDCDAPIEVNGPLDSAWTRKTVARFSLARTTTSLAGFVWR